MQQVTEGWIYSGFISGKFLIQNFSTNKKDLEAHYKSLQSLGSYGHIIVCAFRYQCHYLIQAMRIQFRISRLKGQTKKFMAVYEYSFYCYFSC